MQDNDFLVELIYRQLGYEAAKEYFQSLLDSDGWAGPDPLAILEELNNAKKRQTDQ